MNPVPSLQQLIGIEEMECFVVVPKVLVTFPDPMQD